MGIWLKNYLCLALFGWGLVCMCFGQESYEVDTTFSTDSAIVSVEDTAVGQKKHSPRLASILSAVLPGAGQVYNKKYWKIPIIYGGLGYTLYAINQNQQGFKKFKTCYIAAADTLASTEVEHEDCIGRSADQLKQIMEKYRRRRDIGYISLVAVYLVNILDASIDAHFFNFDISDDLSMEIYPYDKNAINSSLGVTFAFKL